MKVERGLSTDNSHPLTNPFPLSSGIFFELRGGNICDPILGTFFGYQWFGPKFPKYVWKAFCKFKVLPFLSWRFGNRGGYIGFKAYGVDSEAYKNWIDPSEVYEGSYAMCLTFRPFASLK